MKYLFFLFAFVMVLGPLTHIIPSARQRQIARFRERVAVEGMFVEFRNLPAFKAIPGAAAPVDVQVVYYGRRLAPSRGEPRERRSWLWRNGEWLAIGHRDAMPPLLVQLPAQVQAVGYDENSCGAYWLESDQDHDVTVIIDAISAWATDLSEGPREITSGSKSDFS